VTSPQRPARVAHIITGLGFGGAELQLHALVGRSRHECDVITLCNPGAVASMLSADGVVVTDLGMRSNRDVLALWRLVRLLRRGHYDVVHTHLYRACVYGRLAAWLARVPHIVSTEHSLGETQIEHRRKTGAVRLMYRVSEWLSDVTIAVSPEVSHRLAEWGVPERKIVVIPNGIAVDDEPANARHRSEVRRELGIPPDAFVIGGVGRLHATKRFDVLVDAVAPLLRGGCRLLLVGDGDEASALRQQVTRLGVADATTLTGARADVPRLLAAMDVFVSPSPEETFGLATVEAVHAGLPVVYVQCPALAGQDVPAAYQVALGQEQLRSAVDAVRQSADAQPRTADAGERLASRFSLERTARAVDDLYGQLLKVNDGRMTRDELVAWCLSKPGAWLDEPWEGDEVVKVADKVFAFLGAPGAIPARVGLKCGRTADEAAELRARYPQDVAMSPYVGRYGWNTVTLTGSVADDELRELVDASYDAVVGALPRGKRP
jgi:glycosyltransferase involved in cell wall biosynthesis/predicted DNA-binding protein (MmcQ/YjbR family)